MTERLFTRSGHKVETAENGSQALELLRKDVESGVKRFDLVLTDLQMPVMDGLEFVRRFRQLEASHGSPERQLIVGMSANSDAQSRQEALDVGMDYFLSKPFKYAELKAVLSSHSESVSHRL
jgi:CheY-like chemotaxis protein